jgi:hypothetical protein
MQCLKLCLEATILFARQIQTLSKEVPDNRSSGALQKVNKTVEVRQISALTDIDYESNGYMFLIYGFTVMRALYILARIVCVCVHIFLIMIMSKGYDRWLC